MNAAANTITTEPGLGPLKEGLSTSACKGQYKTVPHSDFSSKVKQSRSRKTEEGVKIQKCPVCGNVVRYFRIRGNLSPRLQCGNDSCTWTLDQREPDQLPAKKKPKAISSRQWEGRC